LFCNKRRNILRGKFQVAQKGTSFISCRSAGEEAAPTAKYIKPAWRRGRSWGVVGKEFSF
jgi:hypothetical protein